MSFEVFNRSLAQAQESLQDLVLSNAGLTDLVHRALTATETWHQRARKLPAPLTVWCVISLVLNRSVSVQRWLDRLVTAVCGDPETPKFPKVTKEAIGRARKRLGVAPLRWMYEQHSSQVAVKPSYRGHRVFGVDGTRLTLPDTPENEDAFGRPAASRGETAFPQALLVGLFSLATRHVIACSIGSTDKPDERGPAMTLLENLNRRDLILADRGFSGLPFFLAAKQLGIHFLVRLSASFKPVFLTRLSDGSSLVRLTGTAVVDGQKRRASTLVRLVVYEIGPHERVVLATSLLNPRQYPARELACLYHQRWDCELGFDEIKTHQAAPRNGTCPTQIRSKLSDLAIQEVYALLFAYNQVRDLMAAAAEKHGVDPLKLSFLRVLDFVAHQRSEVRTALDSETLLAIVATLLIDRPRRPRRYRRAVKRKMSNYPLKRSTDPLESANWLEGPRIVDSTAPPA